MNERVVGTCSICGGCVVVPTVLWMVGPPPPPKCRSCGAVAKESYGPVIPMESPRREPSELEKMARRISRRRWSDWC